jgi:Putative prokaryotic signal transducing protein
MLEELITISKFFSLGEAKLAQGKLVSAGISAFVCDENMHALNWHIGMALGGIRLQVPDSQVVRALEVLDDFEPEDSAIRLAEDDEDEIDEVPCCPECESLEIREVTGLDPQANAPATHAANPRQITLWSAAIPFPEPATDHIRLWKCLMCGYQWRESE